MASVNFEDFYEVPNLNFDIFKLREDLDKILENKGIVLYLLPLILGILSVFSFQPFNFSLINFFNSPFPVAFKNVMAIFKRMRLSRLSPRIYLAAN